MEENNSSNEEENLNQNEQDNDNSSFDEPENDNTEDEVTEDKEEESSEESDDETSEEDKEEFLTVAHSEEDRIEEEYKKYKYCPECGNKCLQEDIFCNSCGERLIKDFHCSKCGAEFKEGDIFCTKCGNSLKTERKAAYRQPVQNKYYSSSNQDNSADSSGCALTVLLVVVCVLLIAVVAVVAGFYAYNNAPEVDLGPKAPNCEAEEVKELAVSIFKKNNDMFKSMDSKSVASVILKYPSLNGYDESIDKYNCSGEIWVISNASGFLPSSMESNNSLYNRIAHEYSYYGEDWYWDRYTQYVVPVEYTTQLSEGSTLVSLKQYPGQGKFSTTNGSTTMPSRRPKRLRYENFDNNSYDSDNSDYDY